MEKEVDIALAHRLQNVSHDYGDKKVFQQWFKDYIERLAARIQQKDPARVDDFKTRADAEAQKFLKPERFEKFQFFVGEGANSDQGMVALLEDCDGVPIMTFWKDGVEEERV